jgi:hypothetical protein
MGFNKRYINHQNTLIALQSNRLKEYYGKTDAFIFQDYESEKIYDLFVEGKTEKEILKIIQK